MSASYPSWRSIHARWMGTQQDRPHPPCVDGAHDGGLEPRPLHSAKRDLRRCFRRWGTCGRSGLAVVTGGRSRVAADYNIYTCSYTAAFLARLPFPISLAAATLQLAPTSQIRWL